MSIEWDIRNDPAFVKVRDPREAERAIGHAIRMATRKNYRLSVKEAIACGIERAAEARRMRSHDTGA